MEGAGAPKSTATEIPIKGQDRCNHGITYPESGEEGAHAPKSTVTMLPQGGQYRRNYGTTHPERQEEGAHAPESTATERPTNGKTVAEGRGAKHCRRRAQEWDTPREVAATRTRMAGDIMGKEATEKMEVRRQVFPRWRVAGRWAPKLTLFLEYIQQQLSAFSAGMAEKMSKIQTFTNMEGNGSTGRTKCQHMGVKR